MISVLLSNVTLILGARRIFRDLTWEIQHDQKIGLIGPNGVGKSSILKLIVGEFTAEPGGAVTRARGVTIGYLPQQPEFPAERSAWELALEGNPRFAEVERDLHAVEASFADPAVYGDAKALARAVERQQTLLEEYQRMGGEQYPDRVYAILRGLGLLEDDFHKPIGVLSGGQKKLIGLARLMLQTPSLLLLDEPDNHLDLDGKLFLERFIQNYPGAVVIISHDRYLLDACVTHITELEEGKIFTFQGDYSSYIADKEIRLARQEQLYHVQQREIARLEAVIKRFSIWAKVYDNEKFAKRARDTQNRLEKMDRLDKPLTERHRIGLTLNGWRGSTKVLELKDIRKAYGARRVLEGVNLRLDHGERVGLIGKNGTGKSVLFRLVMEMEPPDSGEIIIGPSVRVAYYAQEHETLDPAQTLVDAVGRAGRMGESNAVAFLRKYLFTYQQANQRIGELSGGERSRLQLALIVLSGANFLLLDEPTNNLDIASAEVLEQALEDFEGTVLVISHDRYFLDRVIGRLLVLEEGNVQSYPGGYSDYLSARQSRE